MGHARYMEWPGGPALVLDLINTSLIPEGAQDFLHVLALELLRCFSRI